MGGKQGEKEIEEREKGENKYKSMMGEKNRTKIKRENGAKIGFPNYPEISVSGFRVIIRFPILDNPGFRVAS